MNSRNLYNEYYIWLCEIVDANDPDHSYMKLMDNLHHHIFSPDTAKLVSNDDNRIADGIDLRTDFADIHRLDVPNPPYTEGFECTLLEMLIALAQRMADTMGFDDFVPLFWEMIRNLGLNRMDDRHYISLGDEEFVNARIDIFLRRKYDRNGFQGLFPLRNAEHDQRKIEIWYQMGAYLTENYL